MTKLKYLFTYLFIVCTISVFAQKVEPLKTTKQHDPLYLLDSIEVSHTTLMHAIKPEDVATITVLKDANATALFGEKGKYGVILILSKKAAQTKHWKLFCAESEDYAKLFTTPQSDTIAQFILNDTLLKNPIQDLLKVNKNNLKFIRILGKAELERNYNISNKNYGIKIIINSDSTSNK